MVGDLGDVGKHYRWHRDTSEIEDTRNGTRRADSDYSAKVDVYEDRVRWWLLEIAQGYTEKGESPADYVVLAIALSYLEGVEQYRQGDAARNQSKARFTSSDRHCGWVPLPQSSGVHPVRDDGLRGVRGRPPRESWRAAGNELRQAVGQALERDRGGSHGVNVAWRASARSRPAAVATSRAPSKPVNASASG